MLILLCILAGVLLVVVAVMSTVTLVQERNSATIKDVKREGVTRRDQTCKLFESNHLADVKQLRRTYRYLASLRPEEKQQTINLFVLQNLPQIEREARIDTAPDYCDAPHVGLPEPDPVVPKRPKNL